MALLVRILRNPDVRRLELAWTASSLAGRASAIAVAVYAYEADGVGAVGLVAFVRLGVAAAASPWLAVFADRRARRSVLVGSELSRAAVLAGMAALVLADGASLAVYGLAVLAAAVEPLFRSAQVALTPSLVRTPEELTAANVVASAVDSIGMFAGPALGALLLVAAGTGTVFAFTAALSLLAVLLAARIAVAGEPALSEEHAGHTLLAGWRTIASEPGLRVLVGLFTAQTVVAGMLNVLVVVIAIELLDLGTSGVGWLDGMVGVGAALGVVAVAGMAGRPRLAGVFATGLLLWGVPLVLVAAYPESVASFLLFLVIGVGNTLVDVTGVTLMQRSAPDEVLGRVFGAFEGLLALGMGLGSLLAPALDATLGTRGAVLVAGLVLPVALLPLWRPLVAIDRAAPVDSEHVDLLRGIPIFAPLAPPALERLAQALVPVQIERGDAVFRAGAHGDRFYVIVDGEAAVVLDGWQASQLGPGDFFGEIALLRDVPRTATVRAETDLRLLALDRETFLATVTGDQASAEAAGSIVAARLPRPVIG
jgi:MFS family permease